MRFASIVAALSLLLGCGDAPGGAGGSSSGEGGATSAASGDGGTDPGGSGGAVGGGPVVDPSTLPDSGSIFVGQWGQTGGSVSASFQRGRGATAEDSPDGEIEQEGPCTLVRCSEDHVPTDTTFLDAGTFGLTGALLEVAPERGERGDYFWEGPGQLFAPSSTLVATFTGGEVAPATVELRAPPRLTTVEPSFSQLVVTPGQDLAIAWELEGAGGEVRVTLIADRPACTDVLVCRFDAEELSATVPAALIPTDGTPRAAAIQTAVEEHVPVHTHDVTVTALDVVEIGTYSVASE